MRNILPVFSILMLLCWVGPLAATEEEAPQVAVAEEPPASHRELDPLNVEFERLSALCLTPDGTLLACDAVANVIKAIDAAGKQVGTFELDFGPVAVDVAADGTIYCGGQDRLAMLDAGGKALGTVQIEEAAESETETPAFMAKKPRISGIAVSGDNVFVAFGSGWSTRSRSKLYRYDRKLHGVKLIGEGLRGCCQRCDVAAYDGALYVAENAAFRVVRLDRDGNEQDKWGSRDRKNIEGFGTCCNPMNVCFDAEGTLFTAESGLGRVKRYSRDGKFLGLVGYVGVDRFERAGHFAASCSNISIAVTPDGRRIYVMDYRNNLVRVLQK